MGSKGRIPPPHLRRPLPGPGMVHPDPFGPGIRPMLGAFPHYDMLPPPEIMEQKLAAQHVEMQRLATENQRLAATHGTLRQELAAAQHELQILHAQIGAVKSEREQQMRGLTDKISKMETELKAAEPVSSEVQKARADAQKLNVERQELISKVQQLSQDLQRAHADVQHVPALMSELESYRREYHHCRVTYDYEKKLYNDHLESLQVMEKNYITMATEMEKLRAELTNVANVDRTGGAYSGTTGNTESEAAHPVGQNAYGDGYNVSQGRGPFPAAAGAGAAAVSGAGAGAGAAAVAASAAAAYVGAQTAPAARPGYDAPRGPGYDAPKGPGFDASRGPVYDAQRGGPGYDAQRAAAYDAQRGPAYDASKGPSYDPQRISRYDTQRGPGYDMQRGSGFDASRLNYDAAFKGVTGPHGQLASANSVPFGSGTPPASAGSGYEVPPQPQGGNPVRR